MASKLTLIALALGATLISSACSEQSKPDKVAKNFLDSIYSGNVNHAAVSYTHLTLPTILRV